jgi:hypothetical protein
MRIIVCVAAVILSGCGSDAGAPAPVAEGPIVVRQWDETGRAVVLKARSLRQASAFTTGSTQDLDLDGVLVRAPLEDGVFVASAASARYTPKGKPTAALPAPGASDGQGVAVAGTWRGAPIIGRASRVEYDAPGHSLRLIDLELCYLGMWCRYAEGHIHLDKFVELRGGASAERVPIRPAPLGVVSALAALPEALEVPALSGR